MSADISKYINLVPVANSSQPEFMAMIAATVQPFADINAFMKTIPITLYDIDSAIGVQLDTLGQLIGVKRPPDFTDTLYRLVLKVRILNNHWLCNKPSAYELANQIFSALGYVFLIEDHADLSITLILIGAGTPDPSVISLLTGGYLDIKPVTIRIAGYAYQSASGPVFGFDLENSQFAGFDQGSWALFA